MIVDSLDILSDKQVIDKIEYSDHFKDLVAPCDWGEGQTKYVMVLSHGAFTTGTTLEIQLVGANKADFSDAFMINSTGAISQDAIVHGFSRCIAITPIGKKYRYFALKFLPASGTEDSAGDKPESTCPTEPMLKPQEAIDNAFSAFIMFNSITGLTYPMVNADKETA